MNACTIMLQLEQRMTEGQYTASLKHVNNVKHAETMHKKYYMDA